MSNVALLLGLLLTILGQAGQMEELTPQRLAELIDQQRSGADPFYVKFRIEHQADDALLAAQKDVMRPVWTEATVAFDGPRQYCKSHSLVVKGDKPIETERVAVFTGDRSLIREAKRLQIQPEKSAFCSMNEYTSIMMWPVTDNELRMVRELGAKSPFLPAMLQSDNWGVEKGTEIEEGVSCRVMTTKDGKTKFWLDPKKSYALVRTGLTKPFPGFTSIDTRYHDHVKVTNGFYLPRRIESVCTMTDPQGNELGRRTNILTVSEIRVGSLPPGLFDLSPKIGETVIDQTTKQVYEYYPSNDQTLEHSIERVKPALAKEKAGSSRSLWIVALGSVTLGFVSYGVARAFRRKRTPQHHQ